MKVDYKKLEELRGKTKLTLLDWITIKILRLKAEREAALVNKAEHCNIGVDWHEADSYEL